MRLGQPPDRRLRHLDSVLEFVFGQLDLQLVLLRMHRPVLQLAILGLPVSLHEPRVRCTQVRPHERAVS